jgi:copper(I)-binding protein
MVQLNTTTSAGEMKQVTSLAIPAGGTLRLHTGGDHLMLMNLHARPKVGQTVTFRLRFATSAPITVRARVEPATYQPGN